MTTEKCQRQYHLKVPTNQPDDSEGLRVEALELIRSRRTMVLATALDDMPWAAPVYFVYKAPGFYFFSSPTAHHIVQGINHRVAATIFADSGQWEDIQGVQMCGHMELIHKKTALINIGARFILKFPFAEPFLAPGRKTGIRDDRAPHVGNRVQLYGYFPSEIFYVNNRFGFGKRVPIVLPGK